MSNVDEVLRAVKITSHMMNDFYSDGQPWQYKERLEHILARDEPLINRNRRDKVKDATNHDVVVAMKNIDFRTDRFFAMEECLNEGHRPVIDYAPFMVMLWILGKIDESRITDMILELHSNRLDFQVAYKGNSTEWRHRQPLLPQTIVQDWRAFMKSRHGGAFLDSNNSYVNLNTQDVFFSERSQGLFLTFLSNYVVKYDEAKYGRDANEWYELFDMESNLLKMGIVNKTDEYHKKNNTLFIAWNDWFRHTTNDSMRFLTDLCNMFGIGCAMFYNTQMPPEMINEYSKTCFVVRLCEWAKEKDYKNGDSRYFGKFRNWMLEWMERFWKTSAQLHGYLELRWVFAVRVNNIPNLVELPNPSPSPRVTESPRATATATTSISAVQHSSRRGRGGRSQRSIHRHTRGVGKRLDPLSSHTSSDSDASGWDGDDDGGSSKSIHIALPVRGEGGDGGGIHIAAEKAEAERIAAEKAEAERIAAEKAEAERIAAEKAEAERIAAEKAEAEAEKAEKAEQRVNDPCKSVDMFENVNQINDTVRRLVDQFKDSGYSNFEYLSKICCAMIHSENLILDNLQFPLKTQRRILENNNLIDWTMGLRGIAHTESYGVIIMCLDKLNENINRVVSVDNNAFPPSPSPFSMFEKIHGNPKLTFAMKMIRTNHPKLKLPILDVPEKDKFEEITRIDQNRYTEIYNDMANISTDSSGIKKNIFMSVYFDLKGVYHDMTWERFEDIVKTVGYPLDTPISYAATLMHFLLIGMSEKRQCTCIIYDKILGETQTIVLNKDGGQNKNITLLREASENKLGYVMKKMKKKKKKKKKKK